MKQPFGGRSGFSLPEVAIALGITAFCLVVLVGLLPVGLNSVKTSRERSAAALCLEQIADSIRHAARNSSNEFHGLCHTNLVWKIGDGTLSFPAFTGLASGGDAPGTSENNLVAAVRLNSPASEKSAGSALISVAWPRQAVWNSSGGNWSNAQGSISTWLIFLPAE